MFDFLLFLTLIVVGYIAGRMAEARHYRSIRHREQELRSVLVFSNRFPPDLAERQTVGLVTGSAVISADYFKFVVAGLQTLFGGRLGSYESLLDRARREAVLRMKEDARRRSGTIIINVKFETYSIPGRQMGAVEILAYGTALIPLYPSGASS